MAFSDPTSNLSMAICFFQAALARRIPSVHGPWGPTKWRHAEDTHPKTSSEQERPPETSKVQREKEQVVIPEFWQLRKFGRVRTIVNLRVPKTRKMGLSYKGLLHIIAILDILPTLLLLDDSHVLNTPTTSFSGRICCMSRQMDLP